jgi:MOSC domain-containing protein YiiM
MHGGRIAAHRHPWREGELAGIIHQISTSDGGVPKLPVHQALVTQAGIVGDRQKNRLFHGGPNRAVCLYSLEVIGRLRTEGHPIAPGTTGENVTVSGIDWPLVRPGVRLRLGAEAEVEVTTYTVPCKNIAGSFADGRFNRISQKAAPGDSRVYARVLREGWITIGDAVETLEPLQGSLL